MGNKQEFMEYVHKRLAEKERKRREQERITEQYFADVKYKAWHRNQKKGGWFPGYVD